MKQIFLFIFITVLSSLKLPKFSGHFLASGYNPKRRNNRGIQKEEESLQQRV